jgi:molybdenum cofactor cytidylyltransferase
MSEKKFPGSLSQALSLPQSGVTSIVGSGGKTTLLYALASEFAKAGRRVVMTTTTKLFPPEANRKVKVHFLGNELVPSWELERFIKPGELLLLATETTLDGKLRGINEQQVNQLADLANTKVLVEADGSSRRPLKGWAPWEPVVPARTEHMVVIVGGLGLGRNLTPDWVHRPEVFAKASGLTPGERINPEALAKVLMGPEGPLKSLPQNADASLIVNQADSVSTNYLKAFFQALDQYKNGERVFDLLLEGRLRWGRLRRV